MGDSERRQNGRFRVCEAVAVRKRRKAKPLLGLAVGLIGAAFFSLVALGIVAVRGPGMLARIGLTPASLVAYYVAAGGAAGVIGGLLLPLATWRWGSALVGGIAAIPIYAGVGLLFGDFDPVIDLVLAAVIGGAVGYGWWEPLDNKSDELPDTNS